MTTTTDKLNRPLQDLRISVIDRCNFRCNYCMPDGEFQKTYKFAKPSTWLNFDQIVQATKAFVDLGVTKVRITGGEPLLREDITDLVKMLKQINGIKDLTLTTNGTYLAKYAKTLKDNGLDRLTVSLDALDQATLEKISGPRANLAPVLEGIEEAKNVGFRDTKINVVLQREINDHIILDLAQKFRFSGHILRFIEYMDVGNCNHWKKTAVVSSKEVFNSINNAFELVPLDSQYYGEVASRYKYKDGAGEVGFISSVSTPFCSSCTRARLSTDGHVFTCLFANKGFNLTPHLTSNNDITSISHTLSKLWQNRDDRYSELRSTKTPTSIKNQKIEMFQIGG